MYMFFQVRATMGTRTRVGQVQKAMELGSAVSMDIIMTEVRRPKMKQTVKAKKRSTVTEQEAKEESESQAVLKLLATASLNKRQQTDTETCCY